MRLLNTTTILPLLPILSPAESTTSEPWLALPPTPSLPTPINSVLQPINGVDLWHQKYNEAAGNPPIVLIHGGLGYSAYYGSVISLLSQSHYVLAVDRRGHGRSTYLPDDVFTFDGFAKDTHDLLNALGVDEAIWVGWSDGAATTLAGLLDQHINSSIVKAFVFAGFQSPDDSNHSFPSTAIYADFVSRCAGEYASLQPSANFTDFAVKVETLEATLPNWSDGDLGRIDGGKVWIVGAEYDEAVNTAVAPHLASVIGGSKLRILSNVSHFAPVQDPTQFVAAVEDFLRA